MDKFRLAGLLTIVTIGVCALPRALSATSTDPLAAFVLLGQTDAGAQFALARVIIDKAGAECPSLKPAAGDGDQWPMTPRDNADKDNFDVTVCEALYPMDGSRMDLDGTSIRLPPVPATVSRVVVFGDTGCKPKEQEDCKRAKDWPFREMADAAAKADPSPDLILHMGDYNYRGTPGSISIEQANGETQRVRVYDAGDNTPSVTCTLAGPYHGQNSVGSDSPDSWKAWNDDFFTPAAKLLRTAPWVFARGNHELCSRAGPGYFYLLDPGSALVHGSGGQQICPPAENSMPLIFHQPYRVDLGGLSVVVLDSANACDQGSLHQSHFDAQFKQIQPLIRDAPAANAVWLVSHRPLWGLEKPRTHTPKTQLDASGHNAIIDKTLQTAFARSPLPKPVHLVLSGHMHRFQTISFDPPSTQPDQLILGNSGVA
ncbi:MAG: metallophosphoesterase, partial [Thiohalocapsa sp.]